MVLVLIALLTLALIAIVVLVVLLVRAAAGRRTVAPGFARPPAQQRVVPQVRHPVQAAKLPSPEPAAVAAAASPSVSLPAAPAPDPAAVATIPALPVVEQTIPPDSLAAIAGRLRPEPLAAPPSLVGIAASLEPDPAPFETDVTLAGEVELGFDDGPTRIGIRRGSALQRGFTFYADELLSDLRGARGA